MPPDADDSRRFSFEDEVYGTAPTNRPTPPLEMPPAPPQRPQSAVHSFSAKAPKQVGSPAARYSSLGWVVLGVGVVAAVVGGVAMYQTLATPLDERFIPGAQQGLTWVVVAACIALVCVVVAVVALVVSQPRTVSVIALIVALTLPPIGIMIGGKFGGDVLVANGLSKTGDLTKAVEDAASGEPNLGAILSFLVTIFG